MRFVISSAVETDRIPRFLVDELVLGRAHYSWKIIARMYHRALEDAGHDVMEVIASDIYQTDTAKALAGIGQDDISLIVKPIEYIRPCFGQRNIAICGWEFPEFSMISHGGNPRTDQIRMLKAVDDIWCWSEFTAENLRGYGVNARCLPPPVAAFREDGRETVDHVPCVRLNSVDGYDPTLLRSDVEAFGDVRTSMKKPGKVFLSVLNPWDNRKCVPALLKSAVAALRNSDWLIVKLIIDNQGTHVANINAILKTRYNLEIQSPNILFLGEQLTTAQMNELYALSDIYISASSAEGLNLPLLEAMQREMVVISSDKTAMTDYVSAEAAIVLEAKRQKTGSAFHAASDFLHTTHFPPSVAALKAAIAKAQRLNSKESKGLGRRARERIEKQYGLLKFSREVVNAL